MVVSLLDVWPLPQNFGAMVEEAGAGGWYPYAPIDHEPCPAVIANRLAFSKIPLAMSMFTVRSITSAVPNKVPWYLPHVVDTSIFQPLKDAPQMFDPKKFVVGMVAMNMSNVDRKGFQPAIRTFAKFEKNHPDAMLYLHCNPLKINESGQDLISFAKALNTGFARPDPLAMEWGIGPQMLAGIYNGFDVLLAPSKGEGFGVPLIEAQACGIPVITTDFTATAELGQNGWLIPVAGKDWMAADSWQARPDEDAILNALEDAYDMKHSHPEQWVDKKMAAFEFAQQYNIKAVTEKYLAPLLDMVEHEPKKVVKTVTPQIRKVSKKSHKKHK